MGTKLGLLFTVIFTWTGEKLRLLPRGTYQVQKMLVGAAESFTEAGQLGLLTPGQLYVCEKPANAAKGAKAARGSPAPSAPRARASRSPRPAARRSPARRTAS